MNERPITGLNDEHKLKWIMISANLQFLQRIFECNEEEMHYNLF